MTFAEIVDSVRSENMTKLATRAAYLASLSLSAGKRRAPRRLASTLSVRAARAVSNPPAAALSRVYVQDRRAA